MNLGGCLFDYLGGSGNWQGMLLPVRREGMLPVRLVAATGAGEPQAYITCYSYQPGSSSGGAVSQCALARFSARSRVSQCALHRSRRHRRGGAGHRRRRSSATRTRSRRCAAGPPSRGRRGGGPRPGPPSSTWDPVTKRARRGPRPGRRGAAGHRRSTTTTRSIHDLRPSGSTSTTTRRVEPSTKPPGTPRRSSRRTICRRLGTSSSALPRIYI